MLRGRPHSTSPERVLRLRDPPAAVDVGERPEQLRDGHVAVDVVVEVERGELRVVVGPPQQVLLLPLVRALLLLPPVLLLLLPPVLLLLRPPKGGRSGGRAWPSAPYLLPPLLMLLLSTLVGVRVLTLSPGSRAPGAGVSRPLMGLT